MRTTARDYLSSPPALHGRYFMHLRTTRLGKTFMPIVLHNDIKTHQVAIDKHIDELAKDDSLLQAIMEEERSLNRRLSKQNKLLHSYRRVSQWYRGSASFPELKRHAVIAIPEQNRDRNVTSSVKQTKSVRPQM
jgi:hypothetical protein